MLWGRLQYAIDDLRVCVSILAGTWSKFEGDKARDQQRN